MPNPNPHLQSAYDQLCESYRAIDDMRMKLLGALPLATGTGIFVFLNKDAGPLLKENSLYSHRDIRIPGDCWPGSLRNLRN
jgi:hypothetical protein